jgi:hypothetical protein
MTSLALVAMACGDSPTAPRREITLTFCELAWGAYKNEGESWTPIPSTPRQVTFAATERVAIATVSSVGRQLNISYLTAEQAQAVFTCGGPTPAPTRQLHGSIAGVDSGGVSISIGPNSGAFADATLPTFQIGLVGDGPRDLVATHSPPTPSNSSEVYVDKIIIRRGENYSDGATMPVLDFSSSEAFTPQFNTLTFAAVPVVPWVSVVQTFVTQRGAQGFLKLDLANSGMVVTTRSLPASRLADDDLHRIDVWTEDRRFLFFYHSPADRTLTAGPAANVPVITQRTSPDQLLRIDVASQPQYGSGISFTLTQQRPTFTSVSITATKEYFGGTPATWSLVLPDLSGVPGFSALWSLSPGASSWSLAVSDIPFRLPVARDGDIYRGATVHGTVQIG